MSAGVVDILPRGLAHQRRIAQQTLVRSVPVPDPQLVGRLTIPGQRLSRTRQLEAEAVLASCGDLRNMDAAASSAGKPQQDAAIVFGGDRNRLDTLRSRSLGLECFDFALGPLADWKDGVQIRADRLDFQAGNCVDQVQPMRADVSHRAQRAALVGQHAPIEVRFVEQPVLNVAAGHMVDLSDGSLADAFSRLQTQRIVADVVVDASRQVSLGGQPNQLGGLLRIHGQRLLAHHVLAGSQAPRSQIEMQPVRRRDVDRLHLLVAKHLVHVLIGLVQPQTFRGAARFVIRYAQNADHTLSGPPQRLDVNWSDEASANHGDSDPCHTRDSCSSRTLSNRCALAASAKRLCPRTSAATSGPIPGSFGQLTGGKRWW